MLVASAAYGSLANRTLDAVAKCLIFAWRAAWWQLVGSNSVVRKIKVTWRSSNKILHASTLLEDKIVKRVRVCLKRSMNNIIVTKILLFSSNAGCVIIYRII